MKVNLKFFLDFNVSLVESNDQIEGRWLETVFKENEDLAGGINEDIGSSLRILTNLGEEWEG